MSAPNPTLTQAATNDIANASDTFKRVYDTVLKETQNGALASEKAADAAATVFKGSGFMTTLLGAGVSFAATVLSIAMDQITQVKKAGQPGLHDLIAATLSDALLIEVDPGDIPVATDANGQFRVNAALGSKFVTQLKQFMGDGGTVDAASAEKAVDSFIGFNMQLAVNTGFLALIGGAIPFEHFNEVKEIGEMLEKSLGLGRLTRQFLGPYLQEYVQKPLTRSLAAKTLQTLPGVPDLVHGLHSGVISAAEFTRYMMEHGFTTQFTTVLLNRYTQRATAREFVTSEGYGLTDPQTSADGLKLDGIPDGLATLRLTLERRERNAQLKRPIVEEALRLTERGLMEAAQFESILTSAGLAPDETDAFRQRLLFIKQAPHKRLGLGEMLFLYEASQITLQDVSDWATAEGYGPEDSLRLQLYFELKATAKGTGSSGSRAAAAAHVHAEHIAYINDEFEATQGRAPTPAELLGWVALLDNRQRTKGDVKTELKINPAPPTQ